MLYLPEYPYYLNMEYIIDKAFKLGLTTVFISSERGPGKTYGFFDYIVKHDMPCIFMRKTDATIEALFQPTMDPFKAYEEKNPDIHFSHKRESKKVLVTTYEKDGETKLFGSIFSLASVAGFRGFNALDKKIGLYDECVGEAHERKLPMEAHAFLNAYETIDRNREIENPPKPPFLMVCTCNSNYIGNPLFLELELVSIIAEMQEKGQEEYWNKERGVALILPQNSKFSQIKRQKSALGRLTKGTNFYDMAYKNQFVSDNMDLNVGSRNLTEYRPLVNVGELCIYKHKSNSSYYVCQHSSGNVKKFKSDPVSLLQYKTKYGYLWGAYTERRIIFEKYYHELLFQRYYHYS